MVETTQPPQSRRKIKVILKKSKKPETQADTDVILKRFTNLETNVKAISKVNLPEAIGKSVQAQLKKVLSIDAPDFGKIKQEKAVKQSMPKFSTKPFNEASLKEYDQKDKLMKSKSYNTHPTHKKLYEALMDSLLDPPVDADKDSKKRKRKDSDASCSKKSKDKKASSKKGKAPSKSSKYNKTMDVEAIVQVAAIDDEELVHDDAMDAEGVTHNDTTPKQDRSKWFKQDVVERPETPDPKWCKEPNADDALVHNWFNEMVNAEKDPVTFDDQIGSTIDFTKFAKHCLKKDKITKSDLEGPAFNLLKGNYRNYIELKYNMEQCYLALTDQIDWVNPEGDGCPYDLSKSLPLQGPPVGTTIPVDFFFNKDLEYLKTRNKEKKYAFLLPKPKAAQYELEGLEEMILKLWSSSKEGP
ncbi:hypothetical protein Tco_1077394 [Tanacetum coccineum]